MRTVFSSKKSLICLHVAALLTVLLATSAYRFRCYIACVDQTGTQNDYVEQRDKCREYAQLKVNMALREAGGSLDDKAHKAMLVSLFSTCMGANGWNVPSGTDTAKKADAAAPAVAGAVAAAPVSAAALAAAKNDEKTALQRSSECAFARHSASVSSNAALRAQACDSECSEALRVSPNAPRPAACPPKISDKLSTGAE